MSKLQFKADAVYSEKYTDNQTGEEKTKYTNIGALFEREDGSLCMRMLGSWVNFYPKKANEGDYQNAKAAVKETPAPDDGLEDEIPF